MVEIHGALEPWWETGTEGIVWSIEEEDKPGYEGLSPIHAGDHLTIYNADDSLAFAGIIKPDRKVGWAEYPNNPGYGQPTAMGFWIHWTQTGWEPDAWAKLFFHEPRLRAILKRGK